MTEIRKYLLDGKEKLRKLEKTGDVDTTSCKTMYCADCPFHNCLDLCDFLSDRKYLDVAIDKLEEIIFEIEYQVEVEKSNRKGDK